MKWWLKPWKTLDSGTDGFRIWRAIGITGPTLVRRIRLNERYKGIIVQRFNGKTAGIKRAGMGEVEKERKEQENN